jgi:fructoselysine-6-P-deglycase FrlB-like protein
MSAIVAEIASQPQAWRQAAWRSSELDSKLQMPGRYIAAIGCGTSYFMAQAYAALRETLGLGPSDAFPASEVPDRQYDLMVAISRSGTTTEVARALRAVGDGLPTVALTASHTGSVLDAARQSFVLDFADELAVVQTRFATSALAFLRAGLGHDLEAVAADGERALVADLPLDPSSYSQFVFLGTGWTLGVANEAALKLREAAGAWCESYPAMEYRHGPISLAGKASAVWSFSPLPEDLAAEITATEALLVQPTLDPMAELVLVHRVAVALAEARGLDPDNPRYLSRSVVLE